MQKNKLKAAALIVPFTLFMFGEQQSHAIPLTDILRDRDHPRIEEEAAELRAGDKVAPAVTKPAAGRKTTRRASRRRASRRRASRKAPRGLARGVKRRQPRKSRRDPTATVASRRLYILRREYRRRTQQSLVVTSFRRDAAGQARAIGQNLQAFGVRYVKRQYGGSAAIREILSVYKANRKNPRQAERRMAAVIQDQMSRGVYVSNHLRGRCADIRSHGRGAARLSVLRAVARGVGAKVSVEANHYHVNLV